MTKDQSFSITAKLTGKISTENPVYDFTSKEIKTEKRKFSDEELDTLRKMGWLGDDFETFLVILSFLDDSGIMDDVPDSYIAEVFRNARKFGVGEFYDDPYIKNVRFDDAKKGKFLLTTAVYEKGELFLYDAPDFSKDIIVPKIGFFTGKVTFPTFYEGSMPWMSVCPSEINSMKAQMDAAHGRVLVLGCGLGYYQYVVSEKENVESVTIVEISEEISEIFKEHILPNFPNKEKINIICSDAIKYMDTVKDGDYDFVFADIWEGIIDGAGHYKNIKPHENRLKNTEFTYWIGDQIEYYLEGDCEDDEPRRES